MHGGSTPRGVASPHFQTGRYSKHLPTRLAARYEQAVADPDLLSLRHEIALIQTRIIDLTDRLQTGESGEIWKSLRKAWGEFQAAIKSGDKEASQNAIGHLGRLIQAGAKDEHVWNELTEALHDRASLTRAESARLKEGQLTITVEEFMAGMGWLYAAIQRHVTDRSVQAAIGRDFERVLIGSSVPAVEFDCSVDDDEPSHDADA